VEEGIVPGGGVALVRCVAALERSNARREEKLGVKLLRRAMEEPLRQIAVNAGLEGSLVLNQVREGKDDFGYNAATDTYENLLAAGVIDPTKVVRYALQNAASVAGMILTTEAMIADQPKKKKAPAMAAEDMDDMY
jgi:chaperonin GroEL